jgi:hypothetical protein
MRIQLACPAAISVSSITSRNVQLLPAHQNGHRRKYVIIWCLRSTMSQRIIGVSLLRKVPWDISQSSMKLLVEAKVIWGPSCCCWMRLVRSFSHPAVTPMYVRPCSFSVSVSSRFSAVLSSSVECPFLNISSADLLLLHRNTHLKSLSPLLNVYEGLEGIRDRKISGLRPVEVSASK